MTIVQLIYASTATEKFSQSDLQDLLGAARAHNTEQGIGGMLVYHEGSFLQILEGPTDRIDTLMARIQRDPRHHHYTLLLREEVEERQFADWSMGFVDTSGLAADLDGFVDYKWDIAAALADGSTARRVLDRFKGGDWHRFVH